jgi:CPA1 family monovalent cation:H+ antiporter
MDTELTVLAVLGMDPDIVLLIVLPPLLYSAAFFSSLRELRTNLRSISLLAVGLVLVTTGAVAVVAHMIVPGIRGRPRSCSARSSPPPTPSQPARSCSG